MRLIDADILKTNRFVTNRYGETIGEKRFVTFDEIDKTPTVDPVVHAKWEALASVKNPTWFKCSRCGREIHIGYIENLSDYPYCHCGAKMDKED